MIKQPIIIVPFDTTPHFIAFRYGHKWWRRRIGSINCAISVDGEVLPMHESSVVAMLKKDLNPKLYWQILDECSLKIRWPRLR